MADGHAPGAGARHEPLGSEEHLDARAHRPRAVYHRRGPHGLAARLHQEDAEDAATRFESCAEAKERDHMTKKQKGRIGPSFDDFLKQEGIYENVTARAIKRVIARQLDALMQEQGISKTELAKSMKPAARSLTGCSIRRTNP